MNKYEFFNKLADALSELPQEEVQKTIDYYLEIINDAVEDGEDEQTVITRLGDIDEIAEKIINEAPAREFIRDDVKNNMSVPVIILLIIGFPVWLPILITVLSVMFSLYIVLWSIAVSLFAVFAVLVLSGIGLLISTPFLIPVSPLKSVFSLGAALVGIGLSVFIFYISVWSSKLTVKLTVFFIRKIKGVFHLEKNKSY